MSETITLGGGCFWCTEAIFQELRGVLQVESGYMGGSVPNPTYQQVCTGTTGHAEVVQVTFDPGQISLADLLRIFFTLHDPTTLNRQGADVGTQYRSVIFYQNTNQKTVIEQVILEIAESGIWADPIITTAEPATTFYLAESYHQNYFVNNASKPYCKVIIAPKVAKLRKEFQEKLKK